MTWRSFRCSKKLEKTCPPDLIGLPELKSDARFAERQARKQHRTALRERIESALINRSAADWESLFNSRGVPAGQVLSVPQILADAQIEARGFVESLAGTTSSGDAMRITRPGFRFEENFPQPATPPSLGQNTRGWLLILGLQPAEIDKLAADGVIALGKTTSTETA